VALAGLDPVAATVRGPPGPPVESCLLHGLCGRLCRLRGQGVAAAATGASEGHPGQGSASHRPRGLHCCPRGIRHLTPSGRPGDEAPDAADLVRLSVELAEKPSQGLPERGRAVEDVLGEVPILVAHGDPGPSRVAVDPTIVVDQGEDQLHDGTVGHGAAHGRVRRVVEVAGRIGRPDSYRARARASASASIGSVSSGAYPEGLLRRSGTVRRSVRSILSRENGRRRAPSTVGMVWHLEPMF
jgi:hypothetical protein